VPRPWIRRVLVAAAWLWSGSIVGAAYAVSRPDDPIRYTLGLAVYGIGGVVCHQQADRSFHLWAAQLPVCARCTGVYAGAALATLWRFPWPDRWRPAAALAAGAVPTAATILYEWMGGPASNSVRAAAGAVLGCGVALIVLDSVRAKRE
jgi:uncharacterized membrane protein